MFKLFCNFWKTNLLGLCSVLEILWKRYFSGNICVYFAVAAWCSDVVQLLQKLQSNVICVPLSVWNTIVELNLKHCTGLKSVPDLCSGLLEYFFFRIWISLAFFFSAKDQEIELFWALCLLLNFKVKQ